jgi:Kef-type K+ transport system membrane component KefB
MPHGELPLPLILLLVFGSAKLLGEIFERLRQPALVGEILAGALLGPSVANWIAPNETLNVLADLGVMFLLFSVGLEVKASELLSVGATAALVAVLGVIVPFAAGWGLMLAWGAPQIEAIFVGAALVATSIGITASALAARGLLATTASQVILAAAVIDDVLGLIVLAVVSSLARGEINIAGIMLTAVLATAFTVIVAKWGSRAASRVVPRVQQRAQAEESQFHLALLLLFGLAALAVYTGVAAIVGAFLAGMALSETVDARVRDLARGVNEFLVPFFLAGIGLHLDLAPFRSGETVALAAIVFAAAVLTKLIGCGLGAMRLPARERLKIGLGMVPRGEVGMVVAQMGLTLTVITPQVYGIVVFMSIATTMITPPLLRVAFPRNHPEAPL